MRLVVGARGEPCQAESLDLHHGGMEAPEESGHWLLASNTQKNQTACVGTKARNNSTSKENGYVLKQARRSAWVCHHGTLKEGFVRAALRVWNGSLPPSPTKNEMPLGPVHTWGQGKRPVSNAPLLTDWFWALRFRISMFAGGTEYELPFSQLMTWV